MCGFENECCSSQMSELDGSTILRFIRGEWLDAQVVGVVVVGFQKRKIVWLKSQLTNGV